MGNLFSYQEPPEPPITIVENYPRDKVYLDNRTLYAAHAVFIFSDLKDYITLKNLLQEKIDKEFPTIIFTFFRLFSKKGKIIFTKTRRVNFPFNEGHNIPLDEKEHVRQYFETGTRIHSIIVKEVNDSFRNSKTIENENIQVYLCESKPSVSFMINFFKNVRW